MKKLLQKVSNWLRSRVTAIMSEERRMKSEEVKGIPINCGIVCTPVTPDSCTPERNGERSEPLLLLIEEFIDEHYRVRLNTLSQQYEVCERGTERWAPVSGTLCNRILMELNRVGIILAKPYLVKTVHARHSLPPCTQLPGVVARVGWHRAYRSPLPSRD